MTPIDFNRSHTAQKPSLLGKLHIENWIRKINSRQTGYSEISGLEILWVMPAENLAW